MDVNRELLHTVRKERHDVMNTLEARLSVYEREVNSLPVEKSEGYEQKLLETLLARSEIKKVLESGVQITPPLLIRLSESDRLLKGKATRISNNVGANTLLQWREVRHPPQDDWWWSLDKEASRAEETRNAWLTIITVIASTIAVILITDIVSRFIGDAGGTIDKANPVTQLILGVIGGILSLLGGAALTESKYPSLEKILPNLEIFKSYKAKKRAVIAGVILLIAAICSLFLPVIARAYQKKGYTYQQQNDISMARECYQRALRLYPDFAKAHYSLATIYESYQQFDEAIKEYSLAIESDSNFYPARNNLARLYLLRAEGKDLEKALQILSDALRSSPIDENVQYSLYKNLGWANLNLNNYTQANTALKKAIVLKPDGAAAHCLLVYVLEALRKPGLEALSRPEIVKACESCVAYSPGQQDVEAKWVDHANEILNNEEE